MTSIGVTTATASVIPAARPARVLRRSVNPFFSLSQTTFEIGKGLLPKKVACPLAAPADLEESAVLYHSYDVKRIAIFGTMPVTTAPRPL